MNNVGIVICTRSNSRRLPRKPFVKISGKEAIRILLDRIIDLPYDIILAIPPDQKLDYKDILRDYPQIKWHYGQPNNPLGRMFLASTYYGLDFIIRATHDDILLHSETIKNQVDWHIKNKLDYSYCGKILEGSGVEVIKYDALEAAYRKNKGKPVEHISYFLRNLKNKVQEYLPPRHLCRNYRLTMDYEEDRQLLELVFRKLGHDAPLEKIIRLLDLHRPLLNVNRLPLVSVYTCVYNGSKYLHNCIRSVLSQKTSFEFEYILCDDYSEDDSALIIAEYLDESRIRRPILNDQNVGLASSSNRCLEVSRGKYIIRLDCDDFLVPNNALEIMANYLEEHKDIAILYPSYYDGNMETIKRGEETHHPAGALIRSKCLNEIKFKNHLRHLDGYDMFLRFKEHFQVGYIDKPLFFYTQRNDSLSHSELEERERIKKAIELENLK